MRGLLQHHAGLRRFFLFTLFDEILKVKLVDHREHIHVFRVLAAVNDQEKGIAVGRCHGQEILGGIIGNIVQDFPVAGNRNGVPSGVVSSITGSGVGVGSGSA